MAAETEDDKFKTAVRAMAEELAAYSERRMQFLLENMAVGFIAVSDVGIIEAVNPAIERMSGYSAQQLFGKSISDLVVFSGNHDALIQRLRECSDAGVFTGEINSSTQGTG